MSVTSSKYLSVHGLVGTRKCECQDEWKGSGFSMYMRIWCRFPSKLVMDTSLMEIWVNYKELDYFIYICFVFDS